MPTYEYACENCGKQFEVIASIREHDDLKPTCPACTSARVHQIFTHVNIVTTSKSDSDLGMDDLPEMDGMGDMSDLDDAAGMPDGPAEPGGPDLDDESF